MTILKQPQQATQIVATNVQQQLQVSTLLELLEWNLIDHISPYLDRHMIFPLLDYFEKQVTGTSATANISDNQKSREQVLSDLNMARYMLLRPTHMIDYIMDIYKTLPTSTSTENDDNIQSMILQKQQVLQELESLQKLCHPLLEEIDITERVCFVSNVS